MLRRDLNKIKVSIKIINVVFGEYPQSQTVAISLWNCSLERNSRENNTKVLFIENICYLERKGALNCSVFDRKVYDRLHVTALNFHG